MTDFIFLVKVNEAVATHDLAFYQTSNCKLCIALAIVCALGIIAKLQGKSQIKQYIETTSSTS